MDSADYYLCDCCNSKTFCDAHLNYFDLENANPDTGHRWPSGVGAMLVLCAECAKTHQLVLQAKEGRFHPHLDVERVKELARPVDHKK